MNKIFILGHEITMFENHVVIQRWAVLFVHSTSSSKISLRKVFSDYEQAIDCYYRGCNYVDNYFDGYNYVALLWDDGGEVGFHPLAWRDNIGCSWDMEDNVDE